MLNIHLDNLAREDGDMGAGRDKMGAPLRNLTHARPISVDRTRRILGNTPESYVYP